MAVKKYLNRDKEKKQTSADDEWAHLTGIEEGPKLQVSDSMDVQDRNIFVRGKKPKSLTTTDIIQDELIETGHRTRTTDQYVRLVNAILDARLAEIDKIKKRKEVFDDDIESLQGDSSEDFKNLEKIPIKQLKSKEVARLIRAISSEKGDTESRLAHHQTKAFSLEKIIEEQDKKIKELDSKLREKISQEKEITDKKSDEVVKDELKVLGELYGMDKLAKALKILNESKEDA
jgi:hypothetical protein